MPSIHTKTITINNGDDIDATPIEQVHTELYENDSVINDAVIALQAASSGTTLTATFVNEAVANRGVSVEQVLMNNGKARLISVTNTITGTSNGSTVFGTTSVHGLTTGQPIKFAAEAGSSLDGNISESTIYYAHVLSTTTFSAHLTAADATNNVNAVAVSTASSGTRYLVSPPTSIREGQFYTDGTGAHVVLGGSSQGLVTSDVYNLLSRINGTKTPVYASATTFTVNRIACRDSGNNITMTKSSSTTVDISTTGLNGIAQSGNLTGTVSVTSGSTSVTFSSSQTGVLQNGDVLTTAGGQSRKLISVSGTSATAESNFGTTETTVTFKRGGRASFSTTATSGAVGTCHYNLYVISDGTTTGLLLSTRNVAKGDTLVDLPSGYLYSQILPFVVILYNLSTGAGVYVGQITPFRVGSGWPYVTKIRLTTQMTGNYAGTLITGITNVLLHGSATSYTATDLSKWVPVTAKLVDLACVVNGTYTALRPTGGSDTVVFGANTFIHQLVPDMPVGTGQSIDYENNSGGGDASMDVYSFTITDIF